MTNKFTEQELKEVAEQLRCPNGEKGKIMANRMYQTNTDMLRQSLPILDIKAKHLILEIGHASCQHLELFFKEAQNIKYYGLEKSKDMYQEAKKNQAEMIAAGKAQFFLTESDDLPFAEKLFDRVITVNTVYFLANPHEFFQQVHKVLKADGLFVLTFQAKEFIEKLPFIKYGFRIYDTKDIRKMLEDANFKVLVEKHFCEETISKVGELVERKYIVLKAQKKSAI